MRGSLIAFEGLDQSGKQTQAATLRAALAAAGRQCELLSFPDYTTAIGSELHRALHGAREYTADVMQLLYVANRYELKPTVDAWLAGGRIVLCDRYVASSIAYGEAQGLDRAWLAEIQRFLPPANLTVLLDIAPEVAVMRKAQGRDRYERDVELLTRVRRSYQAQAADARWILIPGDRSKDDVSEDVRRAVASRLGLL
ncbi:MAG: dTMP kinase [Vicinamibacterales bacterium]